MKAKTPLLIFLIFLTLTFVNLPVAQAVCPVCTVAVASGLSISRWLGIDDFISAIWIGGLALSLTAWGWNYLKKKDKLSGLTGVLAFLLVYLSILIPLYKFKYIGVVGNILWGIDKIALGIGVGTIVFWLGAFLNSFLKKRNNGKVYFPFQKVVLPVGFLLVVSLGYYAYCKCYSIL